jgi:Fe-S cluster assembly scaffold protein SufB
MSRKIIVLDKPGEKEVIVPLTKKGESAEVLGLVLGKEEGKYGLKIVMDHRLSRTKGKVRIRGFAKNGARVKITGLVKIGKKIEDVDDFLEMRVLLLDKKSWAVVEPKLEIESNKVTVSHAATVSKIDEDQLFYLTSRGLSKKKAEGLVVEGFLKEITDKIKDYV